MPWKPKTHPLTPSAGLAFADLSAWGGWDPTTTPVAAAKPSLPGSLRCPSWTKTAPCNAVHLRSVSSWQQISSLAAIQRRGVAKHMKAPPTFLDLVSSGSPSSSSLSEPWIDTQWRQQVPTPSRCKKHKSISQPHHTTNTQTWNEASTNCTQLINLKTWLLAEKLTISYLLHWSKHTGGQDSSSLRMLGEQLHQQGSLRSLHTQKPLAARSPIRLTCAHFQRNGTYSRIIL